MGLNLDGILKSLHVDVILTILTVSCLLDLKELVLWCKFMSKTRKFRRVKNCYRFCPPVRPSVTISPP